MSTSTKATKKVRKVKSSATCGAIICEMLVKGASNDEIVEAVKAQFKGTKAAEETSARQQIAWYKSQLRRGLRAVDYVDNHPVVVDLARREGDKRFGVNQLEAPKPRRKASKKAAVTA